LGLPTSLEALAAVNGAVVLGNEGDLGGFAALGTDRVVHLAGAGVIATGATVGFAGITASLATRRLVLETLFGVKSLLASGEHEFSATVSAYQSLVFVHG